jgi:hypothetical protein
MLSRARSQPQILQVQRKSCSTTSEVSLYFSPLPRHHDHITPTCGYRLTYILTLPLQSGRTEHNESLSILAVNLQARVQLGLRRRLCRPASDDPTRRV